MHPRRVGRRDLLEFLVRRGVAEITKRVPFRLVLDRNVAERDEPANSLGERHPLLDAATDERVRERVVRDAEQLLASERHQAVAPVSVAHRVAREQEPASNHVRLDVDRGNRRMKSPLSVRRMTPSALIVASIATIGSASRTFPS